MSYAGTLVLPADVLLVPADDLAPAVRAQAGAQPGDYALTRPRSRTTSRIVDADVAALLETFRAPTTIVDAVIAFSRAHAADPEATLDDAFPMLERLLQAGLLVPADGGDEPGAILRPGDVFAGCEVVECVQALEDTELYRVVTPDRGVAALKLARAGAPRALVAAFDREAAVLGALGGAIAPALLADATHDGRRYLLVEWCAGTDAATAAHLRRRLPAERRREALARLVLAIVDAYAALHGRGVVHGDVHARNVLVDDDDRVRLVDFGLARREGDAHGVPRGGVSFFLEPEYARAARRGRRAPRATHAGEQHAVAALVHHLWSGGHYLDFSLEKDEMLRQIAEEPPLPLARHGADQAPAMETVLARALAKDPATRHADMAALADALRTAIATDAASSEGEGDAPPAIHGAAATGRAHPDAALAAADALLAAMLGRIAPDAPLAGEPVGVAPTVSLTFGAAGVAYALYRLAALRDDPALLGAADAWVARAVRTAHEPDAFHSPAIDITPEVVGPVSPYHSASGIHVVRALVGRAMGDPLGQQLGLDAFVATTTAPCTSADLTLGRSGVLLAGAMLLEAITDSAYVSTAALRAHGDAVLAGIWDAAASYPAMAECAEVTYTGIAHGWAGMVYAALRWCRASGTPLPAGVARRLDELAARAEPVGGGVRWAWSTRPRGRRVAAGGVADSMPGWCNGSAGFVHLWLLAHARFGESRHLELAERAGRHAVDAAVPVASVCCGVAGGAYAALALHGRTGDAAWLADARALAGRAAILARDAVLPPGSQEAIAARDESLYKGALGAALLAADVAAPAAACLPFFGEEGWPARRG